jgi:hypothetical protein
MRKRLINLSSHSVQAAPSLDLETAAAVEFTSEDKDFPVECSLSTEHTRGWRAAQPGKQTIRLLFDQPQVLREILLIFEEEEATRTQEFLLRWSSAGGGPFREIVRQQWNFSPPTTVREVENYRLELSDVVALELIIIPDIGGGTVRASLKKMQVF